MCVRLVMINPGDEYPVKGEGPFFNDRGREKDAGPAVIIRGESMARRFWPFKKIRWAKTDGPSQFSL